MSTEDPRVLQGRIASVFSATPASPSIRSDIPHAHDPLVNLLAGCASELGLPFNAATAVSGLPMVDGALCFADLGQAAANCGLDTEEIARSARTPAPHNLPAILRFSDGSAVAALSAEGNIIRVRDTAGGEENVSWAEIHPTLSRMVSIRPAARAVHKDDTLIQSPANLRSVLSRDVLRTNLALYGHAILATVVINLLALAIPLYTMNVYDRVLPNNATTTLTALTLGVIIAGLFDFGLKTARAYLIDVAGRRADMVLAMRLMSRILGARLSGSNGSIGVRTNTVRELETLREFTSSLTLTVLGDLPFAILFLAVIWLIGGPLVMVPLIVIPVVLALVLASQIPLQRITELAFQRMANKSGVLVELLSGIETLKTAAAERWAANRWETAVADQLRLSTKMRFFSTLGQNLVATGQLVATIGVTTLGVGLISEGEITAGALMATIILLSRALAPIGQIAAIAGRIHHARLAYQSLSQAMHAPQDRPAGTGLIAPARLLGAVRFDTVSFSYREDTKPVLSGVSFSVAPGERVGIMGAIGSGKSTLLKLVPRLFIPTQGSVTIDGIATSSLDPGGLRAMIAYHGQDSILFAGSIRDNILLHRVNASDDEVVAALKTAGALPWIGRLPSGIDTRIGENGGGLSGGQKTTILLARTLLTHAPVLLLDEPTSNLDGRTERDVVSALARSTTGRTLLVVTHKPAVVELVDRLIVLDGGKIAADGPKLDVLAALRRGKVAQPDAAFVPAATAGASQ